MAHQLLAALTGGDEESETGERRGSAVDGASSPSRSLVVDSSAVTADTTSLDHGQAEDLASVLAGTVDGDTDRRDAVASVASDLAADGIDPSTLVDAYGPVFDELVDAALDDSGTATELKRDLRDALGEVGRGVDAMAGAGPSHAPGGGVDIHTVVGAMPYSTFLLDDDHTVLAYNDAICDQLGIDETEALGEDCRESIAAATYSDGRRHETLADKVVDAPQTADEEYDVERIGDSYAFGDQVVYEDRSVMQNTEGEERHISFQAMPFFDADGDLLGVLEFVEDDTERVRRKESLEALVEDVCTTLERLADGDFDARAEFEDDRGVLDSELLRIVRQVNEMITDFEALIREVSEQTTALADSITAAADAAGDIESQVAEQNESLGTVAEEMEQFSATMEEVAASASQVSTAADDALSEADNGRKAARQAQTAVDEVRTTSQALVETVEELDDYMDEIEAVTDVIDDIAEQTNILALNANIEAARAGEAGEGFAVVADEVKTLANETRQHTEDIAEQVAAVQEQTTATVAEAERSHERVRAADDSIAEAVDALESIVETVEDATAGITEVAEANDDQATTVEEVLTTVEQASETAAGVAGTTDTIVAETERQQASVETLSARVDALLEED